MLDSVFIVYKTDNWHSYKSRDIIGLSDTQEGAIELCQAKAKDEGEAIDDIELFHLNNIQQTQGYSGEGEFQFEEMDINVLI